MRMIAPAVTKMLMNASSISHFQAKFISWSMRTRGRVPRIHTKVNTKKYVLPMNHSRPATQARPM